MNTEADYYFGLISKLSRKNRKEIFERLGKSLDSDPKTGHMPTGDTHAAKRRTLDELCGSWDDKQTAEEIIQGISSSRVNKTDIPEW